MNSFCMLIKRNIKLFFKDKGMFFCALITPLILLVLYITFLGNVFKDSFLMNMPAGLEVSEGVINGFAGGQLFSSLLAVCCVTVAFCANMLMVQDKITGARKDLLITPLKKSKLALSYFISTFLSTLLICVVAMVACFIYMAIVGWYMTFADCLFILLDVFVLTMFGTALSSLVNYFLKSQGQVTAVGSIVSSMYGFISGAYMPIASFGAGIQSVLMYFPSTYASSLIRNHTMRGLFGELANQGLPAEVIKEIQNGIDYNLYVNGTQISVGAMYGIVVATTVVLLGIYVLLNVLNAKKKSDGKVKTKKVRK